MKAYREFAETVIVAALIFVVLQATTQTFRIVGPSMRPTLLSGEYVLVNKAVYANLGRVAVASSAGAENGGRQYIFRGPQRGDVIVFHPPGGEQADFVKRIVGVPGDEIDIRNGSVFVNGEPVNLAFREDDDTSAGGALKFPFTVPDDQYFVLGDNRRQSNDSRAWGFARAEQIIGRVVLRYWPVSHFKVF
ncbi:MAG: signal peptidase I [Chloroflexi bacterium]|nr:signal peptidase I [Chloroflexota bacterium]